MSDSVLLLAAMFLEAVLVPLLVSVVMRRPRSSSLIGPQRGVMRESLGLAIAWSMIGIGIYWGTSQQAQLYGLALSAIIMCIAGGCVGVYMLVRRGPVPVRRWLIENF